MSRPVVIVDYDPQWPDLYEEEKSRILEAIGHKVVTVEHIGSTAVPGLGGKPIIDMMAGVLKSTDADECVPLLRDLRYKEITPTPDEVPDWYYCLDKKVVQPDNLKPRNYHLHLVRFQSDHWKEHLLFRDFLRAHPLTARRYYELKKKMAVKYGSDRIGYTDSKTSFIGSVVSRARQRMERASTDD